MRRSTTALVLLLTLSNAALGQTILANGHPIDAETDAGDGSDIAPILAAAREARVVHLIGDDDEHEELLHRARGRLIRALQASAGYDVLVLPVGIFEGVVTDARLRQGESPSQAAAPLYRVWQQSEAFLELLQSLAGRVEVIGGLCRFHATGKSLYAPHLLDFFSSAGADALGTELASEVERSWGGRSRLSRATPDERARARTLVDRVLERLAESERVLRERYGDRRVDLERHLLVNLRTFIELEQMRAGDVPQPDDFSAHEKRQNLEWFLSERFHKRKIVYWEGRGDSRQPLPTAAAVFEVVLEVE